MILNILSQKIKISKNFQKIIFEKNPKFERKFEKNSHKFQIFPRVLINDALYKITLIKTLLIYITSILEIIDIKLAQEKSNNI